MKNLKVQKSLFQKKDNQKSLNINMESYVWFDRSVIVEKKYIVNHMDYNKIIQHSIINISLKLKLISSNILHN